MSVHEPTTVTGRPDRNVIVALTPDRQLVGRIVAFAKLMPYVLKAGPSSQSKPAFGIYAVQIKLSQGATGQQRRDLQTVLRDLK